MKRNLEFYITFLLLFKEPSELFSFLDSIPLIQYNKPDAKNHSYEIKKERQLRLVCAELKTMLITTKY